MHKALRRSTEHQPNVGPDLKPMLYPSQQSRTMCTGIVQPITPGAPPSRARRHHGGVESRTPRRSLAPTRGPEPARAPPGAPPARARGRRGDGASQRPRRSSRSPPGCPGRRERAYRRHGARPWPWPAVGGVNSGRVSQTAERQWSGGCENEKKLGSSPSRSSALQAKPNSWLRLDRLATISATVRVHGS